MLHVLNVLKNKIFYSLMICMAAGVIAAQPPSDPLMAEDSKKVEEDGSLPAVKCLDLVFSSNSNSVINLDCPENTVFNIDAIKNNCGCEDYNILIGGSRIKSVKKEGLKNLVFSKNELYLWNTFIEETGQTFLTVEIECVKLQYDPSTGTSFYETIKQRVSHPIQIVKSGQEYTAEIKHSVHQPIGEYVPIKVENELSVCCNPDKIITISNATSKILGSSTTTTINIEGTFEITGGPITMKFPISTNNSLFSDYSNIENINITNETISIDGSKNPNGCQQLGYQLKGDIYTYQKYKANCLIPDIPIGQPWSVSVPKYSELKVFKVDPDPTSSCPPLNPKFDRKVTFFNRFSCTGSLVLDIENQEDLYITWADENGKAVSSPNGNLDGVPLGQYTVTISNKCCDVFTKTYYLCERTSETSYTQESNGDWCKTVTCEGEGCNEQYTECVTPDRVEDEFDPNQKKCVKKYFYNNVLLGTTSLDATYETEWEVIFEECVTKYFCNGSEVYEEEYDPTESEWEYNEFWEECRRNVDCRGKKIENAQQVEAEIDWEWNDFWEECSSMSIDCNGEEATNQISVAPYEIEDWWWTNAEYCYRTIQCVNGGEIIEQEVPAVIINTGIQGNCSDGEFIIKFMCNGDVVDEFCGNNIQYPFTDKRAKSNKAIKVIYGNNELFIDFKEEIKTLSQLYISDMMGRTSLSKKIEAGSHNAKINLTNNASGIYILNIVSEGRLIFTEKIFIQN